MKNTGKMRNTGNSEVMEAVDDMDDMDDIQDVKDMNSSYYPGTKLSTTFVLQNSTNIHSEFHRGFSWDSKFAQNTADADAGKTDWRHVFR